MKNINNSKLGIDYYNNLANDFRGERLLTGLYEKLPVLKHIIFEKMNEKLSKLLLVEQNSLLIPLSDFTDLINFSIFVEVGRLIESKEDQSIRIGKFTDLENQMGDKIEEFGSPENTFTELQIVNSIRAVVQPYTEDVEQKNGHLIITFN